MSHHYNGVYIHLVWSTQDRAPLITSFLEEGLYACILAKCEELCCMPLAIGGVEDHIHLLVRLHHTTTVSQLVRQTKGVSSHWAGRKLRTQSIQDVTFRWQKGYGMFSVDYRHLEATIEYIRSQKTHHQNKQLVAQWEPHCNAKSPSP